MGHIRPETRKQALERFILIAEKDELGACAVLVDKRLVKRWLFETRIIEHEQVLRRCNRGDGEREGHGGAEGHAMGHDGDFPIGVNIGRTAKETRADTLVCQGVVTRVVDARRAH